MTEPAESPSRKQDTGAVLLSYVVARVARPISGISELSELIYLLGQSAPAGLAAGELGGGLAKSKPDGLIDWTPLDGLLSRSSRFGFISLTSTPVDEKDGAKLLIQASADVDSLRYMLSERIGDDLIKELDRAIEKIAGLDRDRLYSAVYPSDPESAGH